MRKPLTPEQKIARAEYKKNYYIANKKRILDEQKEYQKLNNETKKEYDSLYRNENKDKLNKVKNKWKINNSDKAKLASKKYRDINKVKVNKKIRECKDKKRLNDPLYKLKDSIRSMVNSALKNKGYTKSDKTINIIGCSFDELKLHLESKFEPWMNWNNKGNWNGYPKDINVSWDIDHIIPLNNAKNENDVIRLNHYTNLQPLCSYTNRHIKKDKFN